MCIICFFWNKNEDIQKKMFTTFIVYKSPRSIRKVQNEVVSMGSQGITEIPEVAVNWSLKEMVL